MQRIRIGITGLAVVFLVVLLAAVVVGFRSKDKTDTLNATAAANSAEAQPSDPLADLGVAPGGTTGGDSAATHPDDVRR